MILILHTELEQQLEEARFQALLKPLPPDIQQKIQRYRRWQNAQAGLLGKLLLIEGLNRLGLDGTALIHQLQYTAHGRPYLPGPIDFNISHSGEYVLCALSSSCRVGIDIEKVHPIRLSDFRAQMTETEWAAVTAAADPTKAFLYYWTRKEAAIKAHGHGLGLPLKEVAIGKEEIIMEGIAWPFYEIRLSAKYICHLVTDNRVGHERIKVEEITHLL